MCHTSKKDSHLAKKVALVTMGKWKTMVTLGTMGQFKTRITLGKMGHI